MFELLIAQQSTIAHTNTEQVVFVGEDWKDSHKEFLKDAFQLMKERVGDNNVKTCINKYTTLYPNLNGLSPQEAINELQALDSNTYTVALERDKGRDLHRVMFDSVYEGVVRIAFTELERSFVAEDNHLKIENSNASSITIIPSVLDYWIEDVNQETALNLYAGVLAHEILHLMGYSHEHETETLDDGYFPIIVQDCIATSGGMHRQSEFPIRSPLWETHNDLKKHE